jgi:hypothetical protein
VKAREEEASALSFASAVDGVRRVDMPEVESVHRRRRAYSGLIPGCRAAEDNRVLFRLKLFSRRRAYLRRDTVKAFGEKK